MMVMTSNWNGLKIPAIEFPLAMTSGNGQRKAIIASLLGMMGTLKSIAEILWTDAKIDVPISMSFCL